MNKSPNWALTIGAGVVVGITLVAVFAAVLAAGGYFNRSAAGPEGLEGYGYQRQVYPSNGARIYFTGTNQRGERIPTRGGPMWLGMHGGGCVSCHGEDGRGGVPVMMGAEIPPDIRYPVLTGEEHEHEGEEEGEHPPYTDETIKRAITQGVNPAGDPLNITMPRWRLSERDLDDLLAFLKTLDSTGEH